MVQPHILVVTFPAQGHINPSLQFAKRLARIGVQVTFSTSIGAERRMDKTRIPQGLSFAAFSDGYDETGYTPDINFDHYISELRSHGTKSLTQLIVSSANNGRAFTFVVYSLLIPWVANVAQEFHLPSILLWSQPAAVFEIYYYFFHGHGDDIEKNITNPKFLLNLPGLPPLAAHELPSFFVHPTSYSCALPIVKEHLDILDQETNPKVLLNTFVALETEALKSIEKYKLIGVGPLIPSAFLDGKDPSDTSFGGDLFQRSKDDDYMEWLNSKPESSVIYISFGSITVVSKTQMEEMARALLEIGCPFLWVTRENVEEKEEGKISCTEELKKIGKLVPWCSQVEVLSHPSLGCFVTHCGWNSTSESLASGVPVVAFPQWTDQLTNAKLVEDVWKTGVRVVADEDGIVACDEIKRCLESVMGDGEARNEMIRNARRWKDLAREASREGGSSSNNLSDFVDEVAACC